MIRKILLLILLASCGKVETQIIKEIPQCNVLECYITDGSGVFIQVYRNCVIDYKLVKDLDGNLYWQVTEDTPARLTKRVQAQVCEIR